MNQGRSDNAIVIRFTNNGVVATKVVFPYLTNTKGYIPDSVDVSFPNTGNFMQFVNYVKSHKIEIEKTYLKASSSEQLMQPIRLVYKNIIGGGGINTINIVKSPLQKQNNVVVLNKDITIDKYNRIIAYILPNSFIEFHFYPKTMIMNADGLEFYTLPNF